MNAPAPPQPSSTRLDAWDVAPWAAALGQVLLFLIFKERMPAQVPVHWNSGGTPNRWVTPERATWEALVLGLGIWLCFKIICTVLTRSREEGGKHAATFLAPLRALVPFGVLALTAGIVTKPLVGSGVFAAGLTLVLVCPLAAIVWGFMRLPDGALDGDPDDISRGAEGSWVWGGLFYRNPEDTRLMVPKREGGGWTYNFAHPDAMKHLLAVTGLPALVVLLMVLLMAL